MSDFITNFILTTRSVEPAQIPPDDPEQELMNNVLCAMTVKKGEGK